MANVVPWSGLTRSLATGRRRPQRVARMSVTHLHACPASPFFLPSKVRATLTSGGALHRSNLGRHFIFHMHLSDMDAHYVYFGKHTSTATHSICSHFFLSLPARLFCSRNNSPVDRIFLFSAPLRPSTRPDPPIPHTSHCNWLNTLGRSKSPRGGTWRISVETA